MSAEPDDLAYGAVQDAMRAHPHHRAMMAGIVRWALIEFAKLTDDETAADVAFARWRHHKDRAAKAPRFAGSRR